MCGEPPTGWTDLEGGWRAPGEGSISRLERGVWFVQRYDGNWLAQNKVRTDDLLHTVWSRQSLVRLRAAYNIPLEVRLWKSGLQDYYYLGSRMHRSAWNLNQFAWEQCSTLL